VLVINIENALLLFESQVKQHARFAGSLVAGLLAGFSISVLWEEAPRAGWSALCAAIGGFALYAILDRFVHPVCAFCRDQASNSKWPLVLMTLALGLHSLMDGALLASNFGLRWAVVMHRIPETLAVFYLLRSIAIPRDAWIAFVALQATAVAGYFLAHSLPWAAELTLGATGALGYLALHGLHETYDHAPKQLWLSAAAAASVLLVLG
jgi:zinc transporter ZupT